ncbi:YibE/F family protein [Latilactobacillus curvatus]
MMLLTGILLILLVLVCGWQGLTIFFSLGLNFVVIILALVLVAGGFEPLIVSGLLSLILLATSIFMNTKQPLTAKTAFVTSLIVVGLLIIIVPLSQLAATYGFGAEDAEEIEGFGLAIGLSFQKISIMMIILGSLGAIAETSIAVASGLVEILEYDAQMGSKQLFKAGIAIGEKIIATAFNTLFFSFFGSFLSLTMWFIQLGYPISKIVNHKILIGEGLALLIGVIGVIATVPLTSWILNYFRKPKDE